MELDVLYNEQTGEIVAALENNNRVYIAQQPGLKLDYFPVPKKFNNKPFTSFVHLLCVDVSSPKRQLIEKG